MPCGTDDEICSDAPLKLCSDGVFVEADLSNGCQYPPCPGEENNCATDVKKCTDGTWVARNRLIMIVNSIHVQMIVLSVQMMSKKCSDGTFVGRDPNNNCEFFTCR